MMDDVAAGELFFFGYNVRTEPHVIYKVADAAGKIQSSVGITIPRGVMMHDFAVTQDYAIFLDCPLVFSPEVGHSTPTPLPASNSKQRHQPQHDVNFDLAAEHTLNLR